MRRRSFNERKSVRETCWALVSLSYMYHSYIYYTYTTYTSNILRWQLAVAGCEIKLSMRDESHEFMVALCLRKKNFVKAKKSANKGKRSLMTIAQQLRSATPFPGLLLSFVQTLWTHDEDLLKLQVFYPSWVWSHFFYVFRHLKSKSCNSKIPGKFYANKCLLGRNFTARKAVKTRVSSFLEFFFQWQPPPSCIWHRTKPALVELKSFSFHSILNSSILRF